MSLHLQGYLDLHCPDHVLKYGWILRGATWLHGHTHNNGCQTKKFFISPGSWNFGVRTPNASVQDVTSGKGQVCFFYQAKWTQPPCFGCPQDEQTSKKESVWKRGNNLQAREFCQIHKSVTTRFIRHPEEGLWALVSERKLSQNCNEESKVTGHSLHKFGESWTVCCWSVLPLPLVWELMTEKHTEDLNPGSENFHGTKILGFFFFCFVFCFSSGFFFFGKLWSALRLENASDCVCQFFL